MIINKTLVSFAGRVPSPRYIPVGVVGDNCVECVEFRLPTIDDEQTATMLIGCKYVDAVTLTRTDAGLYCADITAQIAAESGKIEAYIRIDGAGGAVWNSETFVMCVCNIPDISGAIEDQEPGALEQTLSAIAVFNATIKQHGEAMEEMTEVSTECAESAAESAERAEKAAERVEGMVTIGPEFAGMLLFVDQTGRVAPVRLGDGLEIRDGALVVTSAKITAAICGNVLCGDIKCGEG